MTQRILGPIGVAAMEKRGLNPETAVRLNVFTASRREDGEVVPDAAGNILVFPFEEDGVTVGEKYRAAGKKFWQRPGGKRTFFNADALNDPGLVDGSLPLVVTEGEIDCLTAMDCGFPLVVSVPDGAPAPPKDKKKDDDAGEASNESGKFSFLWANRDQLKRIRRFILAVDNDDPGKYLADELVRRLGASRCWFVTYPGGCKDINDVLMKKGLDAARAVLEQAKPYPLQGVYALSDYPDRTQIQTFDTGWSTVDMLFKPFFPSFTVVTGMPSSGKSTLISGLAVNMAERHGWKWAIFSPELPVVPHYRDKLRRIISGGSVERLTKAQIAAADRFINEYFVFIDHDVAIDDQDLTLDWVLDRSYDALMRHGIRGLIIDPWNEIEHGRDKFENETTYINRSLRKVIKFGRRHDLATFVLAHPTKDVGKDGKPRVPTLYDVEGSAAWFNKPDFGIVVHRPDPLVDRTEIHIKKVRFEGTGDRGHCVLQFNRENSRFELLNHSNGNQGSMEL